MLAPGEALRAWGQPYTTKEPAKRAIEVSQFFCRLLCRLKTLHMLTPPRSASLRVGLTLYPAASQPRRLGACGANTSVPLFAPNIKLP